jgi:nitronate monooxygenase
MRSEGVAQARPEIVITSVGSPEPVLGPLHDAGALVLADVASIRHADRAVAGGIADGHALRAAEALSCDLAYMGTKIIATRESMADQRYKAMLVKSSADDIVLTTAFIGLKTNVVKPSILAAGLDPDSLPARDSIEIGKDIDVVAREARPSRWRDIFSAGHSASGVTDVRTVDELVARTTADYRRARAGQKHA